MSRPGFSFFTGPDSALLLSAAETLVAAHPPDSGGAWVRKTFWADEGLSGKFFEELGVQTLFGTARTLYVRRTEALSADAASKLAGALARPNNLVWPVFFVEVEIDRKKGPKVPDHLAKTPCWDFAHKKGWAKVLGGLDDRGVRDALHAFSAKIGQTLDSRMEAAMIRALPRDLAALKAELAKIELYAREKGTLDPGALELVSHASEATLFAMVEELLTGKASVKVWSKALSAAESADEKFFPFLALIRREAASFWQLAAGEEPFGWTPPELLRRKRELAARFGFSLPAELLSGAMEAELSVKSGERSVERALELFIGRVHAITSRLGRSEPRRPDRPGQRPAGPYGPAR